MKNVELSPDCLHLEGGADEKDDDLAGEWQTAYARGSSKPKEGPL